MSADEGVSDAVELYGTASCPFTADLREQLEWERRPFVEYDVEADPSALARLVEITGGRMVPALVEAGRVIAVGWRGRGCMV